MKLVEYDNDPVNMCRAISSLDVMICNRMHSFVFSCLTRTPAAMISYAPKMLEFAKTVQVPEELIFAHNAIDAKRLQTTLINLIEQQTVPCNQQTLTHCCKTVVDDLETASNYIRDAYSKLRHA